MPKRKPVFCSRNITIKHVNQNISILKISLYVATCSDSQEINTRQLIQNTIIQHFLFAVRSGQTKGELKTEGDQLIKSVAK
jgi:hypothetical protein